ncbi:phosphoribosyltransferase [Herminiimonas fonticola]|uniref:Putative phosphoribosyltransferase n=1 Tax=Herminiimonas fonticola TaxID=303380 RepID=A0A4V6PRG6_9BURK|nr:phosphoribosyltransferase [Herminiimonas fonticola]RBA23726.1 putative phosphoribosyltransferase [Herminiimonas fonticola]TDN89728.1 putative phosphoribosyltransferase [Herminiimonas fonticola]
MQTTIPAKRFKNRAEAGMMLAERLAAYGGRRDVIVLALPRGGVPVGFAIARALHAPLDILLVRKLGVPGHEEYAMGSVAAGGVCILRTDVIKQLNIPQSAIDALIARKQEELAWRAEIYRNHRPPADLKDRIVIVVDDGLATGATMAAALQIVHAAAPAQIIVAVPVAAQDSVQQIRPQVDDIVCLLIPDYFHAVGLWYEDFGQTSDDEVIQLLNEASRLQALNTAASQIDAV